MNTPIELKCTTFEFEGEWSDNSLKRNEPPYIE